MVSIFALGWFWISVLLFFKSPLSHHRQQQQKLRLSSMPHAYTVTESISIPPAAAAAAAASIWPPSLNLTLPTLCRNMDWDPKACRHWKPALENLEKRWRKAATDIPFHLSHAPPAVCGDNRIPVRLELRGTHFRSWWGHVMPDIMRSANHNCSVACDVRWSMSLHRAWDNAPFDFASAPDLIIDTLQPGQAVDYPTKLALVALEAPGGGSVPHDWPSLDRIDMLISWSRRSDVPINYMYAWQGLCGTGSALSHGLERCMQPVPDLVDLATKKFAASFISNCQGGSGASYRLRFLQAVIKDLPPGSVDNWGKCLHTDGLASEDSLLQKYRSRIRAKAQHVGDKHRGLRKLAVLLDYKFMFAFENSIRHDYVTEKAYHGLLSASLPVVWGAPEIADFMPGGPGSFINALDFDSPQDLFNHLIMLDQNDTAYLEYFNWRQRMPSLEFLYLQSQNFVNLGEDSWPCRACVQFREQFCT